MGFPKSFFIYQPTWWGGFRITLFVLVGLYTCSGFIKVGGQPLANEKDLKGTGILPMNTTSSWVRDDIVRFSENEPGIAWLSGSSVVIGVGKKRKFLPELVSKNLNPSAQKYLYNVSGRRPIDTYLMVQDAIGKRPDTIVLVLNPFWIYNSTAIFYKDVVFRRGAQLWWNSEDWLKALFLVKPSDHAYNLFGDLFPPLLSGRKLYVHLNRVVLKNLSVGLKPLPILTQDKARDKELKLKQSLQFWLLFEHFDGDLDRFFPEGRLNAKAWQEAAIAIANTDQSASTGKLLNTSLERLKQSHIPTLVYLAPISAELRDPLAINGYERVKAEMRELKSQYEGNNMSIVVDLPASVTESLQFRDYLHLSESGLLPKFISERIAHLIEE